MRVARYHSSPLTTRRQWNWLLRQIPAVSDLETDLGYARFVCSYYRLLGWDAQSTADHVINYEIALSLGGAKQSLIDALAESVDRQ